MSTKKNTSLIPVWIFACITGLMLFFQVKFNFVPAYSIGFIPVYFIAGYSIVLLSYYISSPANVAYLVDVKSFVLSIIFLKERWLHYIKISVFEEIMWRLVPVWLLKCYFTGVNHWLSIFIITILFTFIHFNRQGTVYVLLVVEFFLFFYLLGVVYYYWTDFSMLVIVHLIRNICITFIGYKRNLELGVKHGAKK